MSLHHLADLEELLSKVKDESIRAYAQEAVNCYQNNAYRSAIISIWIAVVFDLLKKFEYVAEQFDDSAAKKCLDEINKNRRNPQKISKWEHELVEKAYNDIKLLTEREKIELLRIREDRNYCAHPSVDREEKLFQPTAELARTHIRNAIEILLSNPPIFGKAASDLFIQEIQSSYTPCTLEGVSKILEGRVIYGRDAYIVDLFKVSLKNILFLGTDQNDNSDVIKKYIWAFVYLAKKYQDIFTNFDEYTLQHIFNRTDENRLKFLLSLIDNLPEVGKVIPEFLIEKFKTLKSDSNCLGVMFGNPYLLSAQERLTLFKEQTIRYSMPFETKLYPDINAQEFLVKEMIKSGLERQDENFVNDLIEYCIKEFADSSSFNQAVSRAEKILTPLVEVFSENHLKQLLGLSKNNQEKGHFGGRDQLTGCTFFIEEVFKKTDGKFPELRSLWKNFWEIKSNEWTNIQSADQLNSILDN